jgi:hypothetical protein
MKETRKCMRVFLILAICALIVACTQPTSDAGGLQDEYDEFEVAILAPRGGEATSKAAFTINTDPDVVKVYAKVFNSSRVHLPAVDATSDVSGVTKLIYDSGTGKWSATVKLATPASGTITFMIWAVNSSGEHLYSGDGNLTVGSGTSITVPTAAGYSLQDMGPAGGYIFYDKGTYSDGWRYLEAARSGWSGESSDPAYVFGFHRPAGSNITVGTGTAVGTGEANTTSLVTAMGDTAYSASTGDTKANYAAKVCAGYSGGGYDDWFLPSKEESVIMYQNLRYVAGWVYQGNYWSSSETGDPNSWAPWYAWGLGFSLATPNQYDGYKDQSKSVRPVRAF